MALPMKKSQQPKNKGVILNLRKNNTRTKINSLGEVELKYISYGDTRDIAKFLAQKITDRDFILKILFHQLIKPKIEFDKFQKLTDKELEKIGRAFVNKEDYIFEYFQDTGDFFKDFRQAVQTQNEKQIEDLRKMFEPIIKSTQEILTSFYKNYASVIQPALDARSYIQDTIRQFSSVADQFRKTQLQIIDSVKPIIDQYNATARILADSLKPQIGVWQQWAEQNKSVFKNIGKQWSEFRKKYKIAEKKAVEVLQKYKWFISPSMTTDFIFKVVQLGQKKGRQDKAINKLFVDYFSQNNWQNLESITNNWEKNSIFKKRMKIIRNSVNTLKSSDKKTNVVNVVLPTLIAQIDGFVTDYMISKGVQWDSKNKYWIDNNKKTNKGWKTLYLDKSRPQMTLPLDDLANDTFLNILFQGAQKGKPLKTPFNFNRHKIMHGENVNYGRKDYLIRSFLLIDFLVNLK